MLRNLFIIINGIFCLYLYSKKKVIYWFLANISFAFQEPRVSKKGLDLPLKNQVMEENDEQTIQDSNQSENQSNTNVFGVCLFCPGRAEITYYMVFWI